MLMPSSPSRWIHPPRNPHLPSASSSSSPRSSIACPSAASRLSAPSDPPSSLLAHRHPHPPMGCASPIHGASRRTHCLRLGSTRASHMGAGGNSGTSQAVAWPLFPLYSRQKRAVWPVAGGWKNGSPTPSSSSSSPLSSSSSLAAGAGAGAGAETGAASRGGGGAAGRSPPQDPDPTSRSNVGVENSSGNGNGNGNGLETWRQPPGGGVSSLTVPNVALGRSLACACAWPHFAVYIGVLVVLLVSEGLSLTGRIICSPSCPPVV